MTQELEARLLASIPTTADWHDLARYGVNASSFEHYRAMYKYIDGAVSEHDHLPRLRDLRQAFDLPNTLERTVSEYQWLRDEFLKLSTARRVQSVVDAAVMAHGEEPRDLLDSLLTNLTSLQVLERRGVSITDGSSMERYEDYAKRKPKDNGVEGIPTGLSFFDAEYRLGWLPGELIGIVGRIFIGKTWLLLHFSLTAWLSGRRILLLSPEMPTEEAESRYDALYLGRNGVTIDATDLYRGFVPTDAMKVLAKRAAERQDWITLDSVEGKPFSIGEIPRLIRQYKPDLLAIDGMPLIGGSSKGQIWEVVKEVSYGLKSLAVANKIAIIITTQASRGAANPSRPPALHEIGYGDAFGQACDRILALSRKGRDPKSMTVTIQKFRKGQPKHGGIHLFFDPSRGRIWEHDNRDDSAGTGSTGDSRGDEHGGDGDDDLMSIP